MKTILTTTGPNARQIMRVTSILLAPVMAAGLIVLPNPAYAKVKDTTKVVATWIAPATGSVLTAPATIVLSVDAEAKQANQPIVSVEFFNGATLIGSRTTATSGLNYQTSWSNVSPGTYSLTATATNDKGDFDTTGPVTITVIKANQSIGGFSPITLITYAPNASFTLAATGGASGNPVSFASATPATCTISGSTATIQSAGTCTITADQAGNINYNPAPQVTAAITINKANQSITGFNPASPITYAPGATFTLTATGGASGNAVVFASATPATCTVSSNTATIQSAGTCTITVDQAASINYNPAPQVTAAITINKANQIITGFNPASPITYAPGATFTLAATGGASGNAVVFASATPATCTISGSTATIQSAGTCTITADQAGNINYNAAAQVTASVTINKANQIITGFNPATSITYSSGGSFTFTATGGASGNAVVFASATPATCTVSGSTATTQSAGTCTITADQAGNINYNAAAQVTASVTINKANQIITGFILVTPITYSNGGLFTLTATGGASGNPVSFASTTPAVCAVTGNAASILSVGTCTLTADQAGNLNYNPAIQVTATIIINKADQIITGFTPATPIAYAIGGTFSLTATGGASGNAIVFASASPAVCSVTGSVALIQTAGTCTLTADQTGTNNYNPAPQATASVIINKASQSITGFSPATPIAYTSGGTFTLTASGGASGNAVVFASTTSTVCTVTGNVASILSVGTCTLTADQAGTANYNAANQVTVSVVINKTAQTITGFSPASPVSLAVGGTFTLSATGGASGNPVTFTSSTAVVCTTGGINGATVTVVAAGVCSLAANQAGDATYNAATPVSATVFVTLLAAEAQIYYVHADHLGTPRAITRPSDNAVVWKWENTDPFGANAPNEDPNATGTAFKFNLRFPGQYYDQETQTHYNYYGCI